MRAQTKEDINQGEWLIIMLPMRGGGGGGEPFNSLTGAIQRLMTITKPRYYISCWFVCLNIGYRQNETAKKDFKCF